jgi:hypothetical protein
MRVASDRAKAPPPAMRIKRSAMTLCASNASMTVCDDTENQLFQTRNALLIVSFPIRAPNRRNRLSFPKGLDSCTAANKDQVTFLSPLSCDDGHRLFLFDGPSVLTVGQRTMRGGYHRSRVTRTGRERELAQPASVSLWHKTNVTPAAKRSAGEEPNL